MLAKTLLISFISANGLSVNNTYNIDEAWCFAKNLYFEAGNQSRQGMIAVGNVVLNRVDDDYFPDTICQVVFQNNQFSWTHMRESYHVPVSRSDYRIIWDQITNITWMMLNGYIMDNTDDAVFYHADYISGSWFKNHDWLEESFVVDNHIFYSWNDYYMNNIQ